MSDSRPMDQIDLYSAAGKNIGCIAVTNPASAERYWENLSDAFDAEQLQRAATVQWSRGEKVILWRYLKY